jgi:hypothetical protein
VVPAGDHPERRSAAAAFAFAVRQSGRARLVMGSSALGDLSALDDQAIVHRASGLPITTVAVVRTFPGEGARTTVVVTLYDRAGRTLGAMSGERGLGASSTGPSGQGVSTAASSAVLQAVQSAASEPPQGGIAGGVVGGTAGEDNGVAPELSPQAGAEPVQIESAGRRLKLSVIVDAAQGVVGNYFVHMVRYRDLCSTPCTVYFRPGESMLRVGGEGVRTAMVSLDVPRGGAKIRMRAPSAGASAAGYLLTLFGGVGLITGATVLGIGYGLHSDPDASWTIGGGATLGVGAAMLGSGIALLVVNRSGVASMESRDRVALAPVVGPGGLGLRGRF